MKLLFTAVGLVLILEGIPYFAFPEKMKELLLQLQELPPETLRIIGFFSMALGLLICYVVQRTGIFQ